jgi:hypothetical protein
VSAPGTPDLFGDAPAPAHTSALGKAWDYPPFSVLNAREGWWQDRKRAWLSLGIESELGRGGEQPHVADDPPAEAFGGPRELPEPKT